MTFTPPHPEPEILGAFVDGRLDSAQHADVTRHLSTCDECLMIVGETVRFAREHDDAEEEPDDEDEPRAARTRTWWWAAAAAVLIVIAGAAMFVLWQRTHPLQRMSSQMAHLHQRPVSGRLVGFPYVRNSGDRGADTLDKERLRLRSTAADIHADRVHGKSADDQHVAGIAALLADDADEAVARLRTATTLAPDNARYWSDLAAAYTALGDRGDPQQYADGLAAADHALRIEPALLEALFNRARLLDAMHLRIDAAAAYRKYLAHDSTSEWAAEARERQRVLTRPSRADLWEHERPKLEAAALRNDAGEVHRIVNAFREESRLYGELIYLGGWGQSKIDGQDAVAQDKLRIARAIGGALQEVNGESLLIEAAERAATVDGADAQELAQAHARYLDARRLYKDRRVTDALSMFEAAGAAFQKCRSPMALLATIYRAQSLNDADHSIEGRELLRSVLAAPARYQAAHAQAYWMLASSYGNHALFRDQYEAHKQALEIYKRLGEPDNLSRQHSALAALAAFGNDRAEAWRERITAFDAISDSQVEETRQAVLSLAARTEAIAGNWPVAHAFLTVMLRCCGNGSVRLAQHAVLWRAVAAHKLGNDTWARADVEEARRRTVAIRDPGLRHLAEYDLTFADAVITRAVDPGHALALLDRLVEIDRIRSSIDLQPQIELERGRALEALGRRTEAIAALQKAGVMSRASGRDGSGDPFVEARRTIDHELADLLDRQGPAAAASLLTLGSRTPAAPPAIGELLVQYIELPDRLLVVTRDAAGVRVHRVPISASTLDAAVERLNVDVATDGAIATSAKTVATSVITPIDEELRNATHVVIVPDASTSRVPFALLPDGSGQPLMERLAIAFAAERRSGPAAQAAARSAAPLVIGSPALHPSFRQTFAELPEAESQAEEIARFYGVPPLVGDAATKRALLQRLPASPVVDIGTHALVKWSDPEAAALLFAPSDGDSGAVSVRELEQLDLSAVRVVVLAACRTAASDGLRGDAARNLATAFVHAGAQNAIGTLWNIDDAAARTFAIRFHRELQSGTDPATALQRAQFEMSQSSDPVIRSPRSWAALRLYTGRDLN